MTRDFNALTTRERECLYLATRFMRSKEVAARLGISHKTVEAHFARIVHKIGAESTRHAAALYADHLNTGLSENTLAETARLSGSSTAQSSFVADEDDGRRGGRALFETGLTPIPENAPISLRRSFIRRWKGIDANDLTTSTIIATIIGGAIITAIALATAINLVGAFHQFATIFSQP